MQAFLGELVFREEACVAEWLTPRTLDLEVQGSSLACRIVSLDKELYSILTLFTQVYKWAPLTYCWGGGGNPTMDSLPIQGGLAIPLGFLHATETGISSGPVVFWPVCTFTLPYIRISSLPHQSSTKNTCVGGYPRSSMFSKLNLLITDTR